MPAIFILIIAGGILLSESGKKTPLLLEKNTTERDVLSQVSTIDALVPGAYEGVQPAGEVEKQGNFGIGTFDALDGKMIALEGRYYMVTSDGAVREVDPSIMVPFATVTFFDNEGTVTVSGRRDFTFFHERNR